MAPAQVFFGLTRGQSFGPPMLRPAKYPPISVTHTTSRTKTSATKPFLESRRTKTDAACAAAAYRNPPAIQPRRACAIAATASTPISSTMNAASIHPSMRQSPAATVATMPAATTRPSRAATIVSHST